MALAARSARWSRIDCGIKSLPLAKQVVPIDALGQALKAGICNTTIREVLAPPADHLDDTHDSGGCPRGCVAEKLALQHGVVTRVSPCSKKSWIHFVRNDEE